MFDLFEKPGVILAGGLNILDRQTVTESLRNDQHAVGSWRGHRRQHHVSRFAKANLVEASQLRFQGPKGLLKRFRETAADGHGLADRFHRSRQHRFGAGEFLEGEPGNLGDHVVDGRFERRRSDAGNVIVKLIEPIADGKFGRHFGDGEARRFRGKRRRARNSRVHLDDHQPPVLRIDRELDIGTAGVDADFAQYRNRSVAHHLIFLVGEGQRRRYRYRISSVNAHRIDVLDGAHDDAVVRVVADDFHLEFLPSEQRFLDENLFRG